MLPLLLLAHAAQPVVEAERAFAAAAQTRGQWTAFRAFAAPDAVMMLDGPQPAAPFLKDRKDPPVAVMWWPAHVVTSCDGSLAFSTGPWRRKGGTAMGRYFTVWRHDAAGWRWIYDGGTQDETGMPAGDVPVQPPHRVCHKPPALPEEAAPAAGGHSRDGSLVWRIDKSAKGYRLRVLFSTGRTWTIEADVGIG
ncbi:MAG: hypothetical protein JF628_01335 [Sphingomonas sp.]|nr:hypothetical protein [Sphingomonas sp.]